MSRENLKPATTYPAVVGRVLVEDRQKMSLEQTDIATRVGVSQSTWSRIERGESALTIDQLAKAASALDTSPNEILRRADHAADSLKNRGVMVSEGRSTDITETGLALIGAAALGMLIASILSK